MTLFQVFQEMSETWLILILLLDLVCFGYLAFRLGRDRDILTGGPEGLPLEPAAVRVNPAEGWRKEK